MHGRIAQEVTFLEVAEEVIACEKNRATGGEIARMSSKNFEYRVRAAILPIFFGKSICEIGYKEILALHAALISRNLSPISISQYFQDLKKIIKFAEANDLIYKIPQFPRIKKTSIPRGGFTVSEYRKLVVIAKKLSGIKDSPRNSTHRERAGGVYCTTNSVPIEMQWVIRLMVNGFMRPTDIFVIRHKHVEIIRREYEYLRLSLPETKRHRGQIVTLRPAIHVYEQLSEHMRGKGFAQPDDFLFLPEIKKRDIAGRLISLHFNKILDAANLRIGSLGQSRSLYSLRHTSIMFRLLYGNGIDLLTLARNARTSVQMIERFYASNLSSEMNVGLLQSKRKFNANMGNGR